MLRFLGLKKALFKNQRPEQSGIIFPDVLGRAAARRVGRYGEGDGYVPESGFSR
jgi:hypothetical protein